MGGGAEQQPEETLHDPTAAHQPSDRIPQFHARHQHHERAECEPQRGAQRARAPAARHRRTVGCAERAPDLVRGHAEQRRATRA
jgi:hypothetical protein